MALTTLMTNLREVDLYSGAFMTLTPIYLCAGKRLENEGAQASGCEMRPAYAKCSRVPTLLWMKASGICRDSSWVALQPVQWPGTITLGARAPNSASVRGIKGSISPP